MIRGLATQRMSTSQQISQTSGRDEVTIDVTRCESRPNTCSRLEFWKENGTEFPLLAKVADASSASQPALPSRRETFQRSDVPLLTLLNSRVLPKIAEAMKLIH